MTDLADLADLGGKLRAAGLAPKLLRAWAGTDRAAALHAAMAERLAADRLTGVERAVAPGAAALELFVGGTAIPVASARQLPVEALVEAGLVERDGARLRATVSLLPVGPSLVACDRLDAPLARELACWPDDSSHHLAGAVPPGRQASWLDLGCGSAFAQLARPEAAEALVGLDANPRAVERARLGAALSGLARLEVVAGDIVRGELPARTFALVTCNAPMPAGDATLWRHADAGFFPALFAAIPRLVAGDGMAIVHAARGAIPRDDELPGERVVVAYADGFAVLWWRPGAPARRVAVRRELTVERPHLTWQDREDALRA